MNNLQLRLVKHGLYFDLYRNADTKDYEIWLTIGGQLVEQQDVFSTRSDAIEALDYMDIHWADEMGF